MLHLVNGESTLGRLRQAQVPGTMESADDILMEGPARNRLKAAADVEQRAAFLEAYLEIPRAEYLFGFQRRRELLAQAIAEDETVLWFENDVFCQTNYLDALSWLAEAANGSANLTLVRPSEERLGTLSTERLVQLFTERTPVGDELLHFAHDAWGLLTHDDPVPVADLAQQHDFELWPELRAGLRAQLARLPSTRTGLGRIEQVMVEVAAGGAVTFDHVFAQVCQRASIYGVSDLQVMRYALDLAQPAAALLSVTSSNGAPSLAQANWRAWRISMTPLGRAVLDGDQDYMRLTAVERWVGGTRVDAGCRWRWDPQHGLRG